MITGTETKRTSENEDINALIEKIKQGDREAFMAVTELYQKKIFRLAYRKRFPELAFKDSEKPMY